MLEKSVQKLYKNITDKYLGVLELLCKNTTRWTFMLCEEDDLSDF